MFFILVSTGSSSCSNKFFTLCENLIALISFFSNVLMILFLISDRPIMLNKTIVFPSLSLSSNFFDNKFLCVYLNCWYYKEMFVFCRNRSFEVLYFLDLLILIPSIRISLLYPINKLVVINSICSMFARFIFISSIFYLTTKLYCKSL